jgi:hypothetical protein
MKLVLNVYLFVAEVLGGGWWGALTSWQLVVLILLSWLLLACGGCRSCCCCLRWAALERFFECAPVNIMTAAETIKPAALGRLRRPRGPARRSAGPRGLCAGRSFGSDCSARSAVSRRGAVRRPSDTTWPPLRQSWPRPPRHRRALRPRAIFRRARRAPISTRAAHYRLLFVGVRGARDHLPRSGAPVLMCPKPLEFLCLLGAHRAMCEWLS